MTCTQFQNPSACATETATVVVQMIRKERSVGVKPLVPTIYEVHVLRTHLLW